MFCEGAYSMDFALQLLPCARKSFLSHDRKASCDTLLCEADSTWILEVDSYTTSLALHVLLLSRCHLTKQFYFC